MHDFTPYRALSFDCYGTLIDWETGILQALQPWARVAPASTAADELLGRSAAHESAHRGRAPDHALPGGARRGAAADRDRRSTSTSQPTECREFGASVGAWPAFADTAPPCAG